MNPRTLHIIVAAGTGSRFGATVPKQFCLLEGRPVVFRTCDAVVAASQPGDTVAVVISASMEPLWRELADSYGEPAVLLLPVGGASRAATVANALSAAAGVEADVISIHDGARPLAAVEMIRNVIDAAAQPGSPGALPATPLTDSMRLLCADGSSVAVDRSCYRMVQTPQAFPALLVRDAYASADVTDSSLTDDASVVERFTGRSPVLVEGDVDNIKITHASDMMRAGAILASRSVD